MKALPHRSSNYFETVCCAGIGHDRKWRRLYPVPFRILNDAQKFGRWNWISYRYTDPAVDGRWESQKVVPESIAVGSAMRAAERSRLACALTRESVKDAEANGESLTLIKPMEVTFSWKRKDEGELENERRKHAELARQISMFDAEAKPLNPCPFEFFFKWKSEAGSTHNHTCDDWETSAAFYNRRRAHGEEGGLQSLKQTYEEEYLAKGMRFALGTHSRRETQWLMVGVLRVDDQTQTELGL